MTASAANARDPGKGFIAIHRIFSRQVLKKKKKYFSVEILDYKEYQRDSVLFILLQVTTRHFIL